MKKIILGDCLEVMKTFADGEFSMIWTDPPYNVGKEYGGHNDSMTSEEYLAWLSERIVEMKRVSGNKIAMMVPQKYMLEIWGMLGADYRQIVLSYSPEGALRFGYCNQFTSILTNIKPKGYVKNVWHNCQMPGLGWFFRENSYGHPGYTSEDISKRVIGNFSVEGDTVLDPFFGTGTTGVAANYLNRKWQGIELNPEYIEIARKRLSQEMLF